LALARPETAASRIVWAAGYFADENYFLRDLKVIVIPGVLNKIGSQLVRISPRATVRKVTRKLQES